VSNLPTESYLKGIKRKYIMKNLNYLFNALLVVAIAVLYFLHFSANTCVSKKGNHRAEAAAISAKAKTGLFAYVDLDSLNEKITYIKQNRTQYQELRIIVPSAIQKIMGIQKM
jgi:hypothetical protein